jgi:hypothetical protein
MKKLLMILGIIFIVILVWLSSFIFSLYLDYNKSKKYVEEAVQSVIPEWNLDELKGRMHPEVIKKIPDDQFLEKFNFFRQNFIHLQSYGEIEGEVNKTDEGYIIGVYKIPLTFENTSAEATITVQKVNYGWTITDFRIKSTSNVKSSINNAKTSSI